MSHRSRLLLLIPHLGGGGAEKVISVLASRLSASRYDIHLGLVTQPAAFSGSNLPDTVSVHYLSARRVRDAALPLLRLVRELRPALILSGMAHLNFVVLMQRRLYPHGTRVLVRQNGTVSSQLESGTVPPMTRAFYRLLYPRADRVICQSPAMARDLCRTLNLAPEKTAVLLNPVDLANPLPERKQAWNAWCGPGPHLLAVGRLSREKGFDLLVRAVAALQNEFASLDLTIAGTGPETAALHSLAHALGLEASVRFAGDVPCPAQYFSGATLYVLSSRHEGLPNAMLEAAAAGLPIVATQASEGIVELIAGQPGVWMADEISCSGIAKAVSTALNELMPQQRFAHAWVEPFDADRAIAAYEELIDFELDLAAR